jgi:hypothetical protein
MIYEKNPGAEIWTCFAARRGGGSGRMGATLKFQILYKDKLGRVT